MFSSEILFIKTKELYEIGSPKDKEAVALFLQIWVQTCPNQLSTSLLKEIQKFVDTKLKIKNSMLKEELRTRLNQNVKIIYQTSSLIKQTKLCFTILASKKNHHYIETYSICAFWTIHSFICSIRNRSS